MVHSSLKVSHCEKDSAVQSIATTSLLHSLNPTVVHQLPLDSSTPCSAHFKVNADYYLQELKQAFSYVVTNETSKDFK